uniref:Sensitive to high expression protein 9, mitochondrial n=1 Tax=Bionectria ochroleuca TaxID=29856 RepID=A0A8H7N3P0_BIOOC
MQPFGRPIARAIVSQTRLGLQASSRFSSSLNWGPCLQPIYPRPCSLGPRSPWRSFSSQPPKPPKGAIGDAPIPPEEHSQPVDKLSRITDHLSSTREHRDLPSALEKRRSEMNQKFSEIMDNVQSRVLTASKTLNEMTGYTSIEAIKADNAALEISLADAQARVRSARQAYKTSNSKRAATQREVTTLLARKESWTPSDLERFTELYRTDHSLEGEVAHAQESLTEAEAEEQSLSQRLNNGILKRYHEEQIWSDRIRRASTWGTWGLMGMNFLLFVVIQFFAEPWKRRRLVKGVVAEEKGLLEEVRSELNALKEALQQRVDERLETTQLESQPTVAAAKEAVPETLEETGAAAEYIITAPETKPQQPRGAKTTLLGLDLDLDLDAWKDFLLDLPRWRAAFEDLFSDRRLDFRMKDASVLALEGALAGATLAGSLVWIIIRT